jgi:hypothetical protein
MSHIALTSLIINLIIHNGSFGSDGEGEKKSLPLVNCSQIEERGDYLEADVEENKEAKKQEGETSSSKGTKRKLEPKSNTNPDAEGKGKEKELKLDEQPIPSPDVYRSACHSHKVPPSKSVVIESPCDIRTVYINKIAEIWYGGDRPEDSWKRKIVSEEDEFFRSRAKGSANHMFINFDIGYRDNTTSTEVQWKSFHLLYQVTETEEDSQSSETKNKKGGFKVGFKTNPAEDLYYADFYNNSKCIYKNDEKKSITLPPSSKEEIEALEKLNGIKCTSNKSGGGYHSEAQVIVALSKDRKIFSELFQQVKKQLNPLTIDGCFVKFYSTQDVCNDCQTFLFESRNLIEKLFNEELQKFNMTQTYAQTPIIFVGMGTQLDGRNWWVKKDNLNCNFENLLSNGENFYQDIIRIETGKSQPYFFSWYCYDS